MIYLDNAASAPLCPESLRAFERAAELFGNPSSLHGAGFEAEREIAAARATLAGAVGALPGEIFFTPGGTFSDNLAILGAARRNKRLGNHIITGKIEHPAVLNAVAHLEKNEGFEATFIEPDGEGRILPGAVFSALREDTCLVSLMLLNNELGTKTDIPGIFAGIRARNSPAVLHTDAVQALGRMPVDAGALGADLISFSAHKLHAHRGIGALYVKKGTKLSPLTHGGGQEGGLVPGTESPAHAASFAASLAPAKAGIENPLYKRARGLLLSLAPGLEPVGAGDGFGIFCVSLPGYRGETVLHYLSDRGIYISAGSACAKGKKSHVIAALGLPERLAMGALRVSLSRFSTGEEIRALAAGLNSAAAELAH